MPAGARGWRGPAPPPAVLRGPVRTDGEAGRLVRGGCRREALAAPPLAPTSSTHPTSSCCDGSNGCRRMGRLCRVPAQAAAHHLPNQRQRQIRHRPARPAGQRLLRALLGRTRDGEAPATARARACSSRRRSDSRRGLQPLARSSSTSPGAWLHCCAILALPKHAPLLAHAATDCRSSCSPHPPLKPCAPSVAPTACPARTPQLDGEAVAPPRALPWYPNRFAWQLDFSRAQLRKVISGSDVMEGAGRGSGDGGVGGGGGGGGNRCVPEGQDGEDDCRRGVRAPPSLPPSLPPERLVSLDLTAVTHLG